MQPSIEVEDELERSEKCIPLSEPFRNCRDGVKMLVARGALCDIAD